VKYRVNGTMTWFDGYPLWFDTRSSEYKGSLVELQPGTDYEIELELQTTLTKTTFFASTWNETFPISETIIVDDMTSTLSITQSGTKDGYILYTHAKGKTATIDVADSNNFCINVDASYVIIRDLILKNASIHGIKVQEGNNDIVIERCDISGWGRWDTDGYGMNALDSAVHAGEWSAFAPIKRIIVQRNVIHHPRADSNSWDEYRSKYTTWHPAGPQAISFINTDGNHVLRYNHVYSDIDHYYNDIFGAGSNYHTKGFPGWDSDIYGNRLENCWDDGIESEGGNRNVRIWGNYINNTYVKIACAATEVGPLYIWRNVCGVAQYKDVHDDDSHGTFLKCTSKDYAGSYWGDGRIYVFHNTVLQPPPKPGQTYPSGCSSGLSDVGSNITELHSRNNIIQVHKPWWDSIDDSNVNPSNSFDYDLFNGEYNNQPNPPAGIEDNGIKGTPTYDPSNGDWEYYLAIGTNGHDDGIALNNFNDGYEGTAPDMGAHERGTPPMEFGPKVDLKPLRITTAGLTTWYEDQPLAVDYNAVHDPSVAWLDWSVVSNASFLWIDPDTGWLKGTPDDPETGTFWVMVTVTDDLGFVDSVWFNLEVINNEPPVTNLSVVGPKIGSEPMFVTSSTTFYLSAEDADGVDVEWYYINDVANYTVYQGGFNITPGATQLVYGATDVFGENETGNIINVSLDDEPPVTTLSVGEPKVTGPPFFVDVSTEFNLMAEDSGCGLAQIEYSTFEHDLIPYTANFTLPNVGSNSIRFFATDKLGNTEEDQTKWVTVTDRYIPFSNITGKVRYYNGSHQGENTTGVKLQLLRPTVWFNATSGMNETKIQTVKKATIDDPLGNYELIDVSPRDNYTIKAEPPDELRYIPGEQSGYEVFETEPFSVSGDMVINISLYWKVIDLPPPPPPLTITGNVTYKGGPKDGQVAAGATVVLGNRTTTVGSDGRYNISIDPGVEAEFSVVPVAEDLGSIDSGRNGYLAYNDTINTTYEMTVNVELEYYYIEEPPPGNPSITITRPLMDSVFEPDERITVSGVSQNLPEGAIIRVDLGEQTSTTTVRADGSWYLRIYCPDEPGEYQLVATAEGASDYVYIEIEDYQGGSTMLVVGIIIAVLAIIIIIVIVVFAMKKTEEQKQSLADSEKPPPVTTVSVPDEETRQDEMEKLLEELEEDDDTLFEDTEDVVAEPEAEIEADVEPSPESDEIPMGEPPPEDVLEGMAEEDEMFSLDDTDL
jgi:hypothetical protein